MIDNIMRNTFGVLTNRVSVEDILEMYEGEDAMFYGNPYGMKPEDVDEVISYFEGTEEYEKCQQLVYVKNDIMVFEKNLELVKFNFSENVELILFEMTDKLKSLINQPVYDTELFEESKI